MKRSRFLYLAVPGIIVAAWAVIYIPWLRHHRADAKLRIAQLAPAVLVWPEQKARTEDPEVIELKKKVKVLEAQLLAAYAEEAKARIGTPSMPPNVISPNHLTDPASPSVTSPAGAGGAPSVAADH